MQNFFSYPAGSLITNASLMGMNNKGLESPGLAKLKRPILDNTKKYSFHGSEKKSFSQLCLQISRNPTIWADLKAA